MSLSSSGKVGCSRIGLLRQGMSGGMSDSRRLIDPQRRLLGINYADYVGRFRGGQVGVGVSGDIIQEIMQSPDFADRFMDVGSYFAARNANQIDRRYGCCPWVL